MKYTEYYVVTLWPKSCCSTTTNYSLVVEILDRGPSNAEVNLYVPCMYVVPGTCVCSIFTNALCSIVQYIHVCNSIASFDTFEVPNTRPRNVTST